MTLREEIEKLIEKEEIKKLNDGWFIKYKHYSEPKLKAACAEWQKTVDEIVKNYKDIGYYKGDVILTPYNFFNSYECPGDSPLSMQINGNKLFIEKSVLDDIRDKNFLRDVIVHEIAHHVTEKEHKDKEFIQAIQDYKNEYGGNPITNPESITDYSKTFPVYNRKLKMLTVDMQNAKKSTPDILKIITNLEKINRQTKLMKKAT